MAGVGCGDNLLADSSSGTRLALRVIAYEDGTEQVDPTRFRDLARDEDCAPARWSDGARYCTPPAGDTVYIDAQCLTEVARIPLGSDARYTIEPFFAGTEPLISRLRHIGDPFGSQPALTWRLDHGLCTGPFPTDPSQFFQLGDALETSDAFARVRRADPTGDDRLQLVRETSDDGLVAAVAFYDRDLRLDCVPRVRPDEPSAECAPRSVVTADYFADAACATPVAAVGAIALPDAIETTRDGCPVDYALGDEVDPASLYVRAGTACFATTGPSNTRFFAGTSELGLGSAPRTIGAGAHRLQLVTLGAGVPDRYVHDTALGVDCAPTPRDDGRSRCLPAAVSRSSVMPKFTDAACSIPIDIAYVTEGGCALPVTYAVGLDGLLRHLGAAYPAPIYEISTGEICAPAPVPAGTAPHVVGNRLPDATFVAVTAAR